ncbi:MAG: 2-polyprenyl-3-methyl-6-methoxy-1,4-benzoquinone monooxygenase [Pseudohongiellaceae bacterium]
MNLIDSLILQADQALRTLVPGSVSAARANPAGTAPAAELDAAAHTHAAGLMRINHTGEVCAQALYQGQALTAKLPEVRASMEHAAAEEVDHLGWCEDRLRELDSRPSLLNPLWYGMSFGLGALAGLAGDKWSLGFVAETEQQVCAHLKEHLAALPAEDHKSRLILQQMLTDEARHAATAVAAGAAELPLPVRQAMTLMARVMKIAVFRV